MKKDMIEQKKDLLSLLRGFKRAGKLSMTEKKKRLVCLTAEDSFKEYDALCKVWDASAGTNDLERLEGQKMLFLTKRRKLFNKAGGFKKNL